MNTTPVVRLSADSSCVNRRSYRADFDELDVVELVRALERDAVRFRPAHAPSGVASFLTVEGHQVLIVPASSRVQIRISLDIDRDERRRAAELVCVALVHAVTAARTA